MTLEVHTESLNLQHRWVRHHLPPERHLRPFGLMPLQRLVGRPWGMGHGISWDAEHIGHKCIDLQSFTQAITIHNQTILVAFSTFFHHSFASVRWRLHLLHLRWASRGRTFRRTWSRFRRLRQLDDLRRLETTPQVIHIHRARRVVPSVSQMSFLRDFHRCPPFENCCGIARVRERHLPQTFREVC